MDYNFPTKRVMKTNIRKRKLTTAKERFEMVLRKADEQAKVQKEEWVLASKTAVMSHMRTVERLKHLMAKNEADIKAAEKKALELQAELGLSEETFECIRKITHSGDEMLVWLLEDMVRQMRRRFLHLKLIQKKEKTIKKLMDDIE